MIWLIVKILLLLILAIVAYIFITNFAIGFKEATCRFFNYSTKYLIQKKNKDGLLYELDRAKKEYKM